MKLKEPEVISSLHFAGAEVKICVAPGPRAEEPPIFLV
jgi:hypothetical protein